MKVEEARVEAIRIATHRCPPVDSAGEFLKYAEQIEKYLLGGNDKKERKHVVNLHAISLAEVLDLPDELSDRIRNNIIDYNLAVRVASKVLDENIRRKLLEPNWYNENE